MSHSPRNRHTLLFAAVGLHALQLVSYKLDRLSHYVGASSRILNDLRTLRRLLLGERAIMGSSEEHVGEPV